MRIDAHQHYWKIHRGDYGWITPDNRMMYRDYLPKDLNPSLEQHQFDGTILVQAAPTLAETAFLLLLAEREESVKGVVGWIDLLSPNHFEDYRRFCANPKYAGFRIMIQDMVNPAIILEAGFVNALRVYADLGVPIDLLVTSNQLQILTELLKQVPNLRGVIDHIGKPQIAEGEFDFWARNMMVLASYPGIYCKLSGMVTEAEPHSWEYEQFVPYIRFILDCFGQQRTMFGSDWPVCLLAAGYAEVVEILERAMPETWTKEDQDRLFGLNAKEFYRL
ncbi:amidohydrolase family protein [Paenibacillus glycinis]|uniref:Amidohydrolase family protein n=1 Tax=Paenibacillus glycinis TaxID=2697035 RepID=A0ABW9XZT5_9BACL|nr:amidohydrolase family protein [Paenibacillus glycinis]NBD28230.1 amidohydrolase family protein [Paenibacillus glycinis]